MLPKNIGCGQAPRVRRKVYKYIQIPLIKNGKVQHYSHNIFNKVGVVKHRKGDVITRHIHNYSDLLSNRTEINKKIIRWFILNNHWFSC